MRYMTVLKFPLSFQATLLAEPGIKVSKTGLHTTLWGFNSLEENENALVKSLSHIVSGKFKLSVIKEDNFFDDNVRVLILDKSKPLYDLHKKIVDISRSFDKTPNLFDEMLTQYGLENYSPHVALPGIERNKRLRGEYIGTEMGMVKYDLMKRKDETWREVKSFWFRD